MPASDPSTWGPNLYRYLERHWVARNTNATAWADIHPGVRAPTLYRWGGGTVPRLESLPPVAEALGVWMLDILFAAGVIDADEAKRAPVAAPPVPNIDIAIKYDPNLSDFERSKLREMRDALRSVETGAVEVAKSSDKIPRRRK